MSSVHEIRLRVRYAETDQMGVVYHANYLVWMEMGRVEYCRNAGVRYRDLEEKDGVLLTVVEVGCRYHRPARYDDEVLVQTSLKRSTTRMLEFEYVISAAGTGVKSSVKLATGGTTHLFCSRDMRPCRLPQQYWDQFGVR